MSRRPWVAFRRFMVLASVALARAPGLQGTAVARPVAGGAIAVSPVAGSTPDAHPGAAIGPAAGKARSAMDAGAQSIGAGAAFFPNGPVRLMDTRSGMDGATWPVPTVPKSVGVQTDLLTWHAAGSSATTPTMTCRRQPTAWLPGPDWTVMTHLKID